MRAANICKTSYIMGPPLRLCSIRDIYNSRNYLKPD